MCFASELWVQPHSCDTPIRLAVAGCCYVQPFKDLLRCRDRLLVAVALHKVNHFAGTSALNDVVPERVHAGVVQNVGNVVAPLKPGGLCSIGIRHGERLVEPGSVEPTQSCAIGMDSHI